MQFFAVPDNGKGITAYPATRGFDHSQCDGGRQGGIDGIATGLQHAQARLRGQGVGGADHVLAKYRRAGGRVGVVPVHTGVSLVH